MVKNGAQLISYRLQLALQVTDSALEEDLVHHTLVFVKHRDIAVKD